MARLTEWKKRVKFTEFKVSSTTAEFADWDERAEIAILKHLQPVGITELALLSQTARRMNRERDYTLRIGEWVAQLPDFIPPSGGVGGKELLIPNVGKLKLTKVECFEFMTTADRLRIHQFDRKNPREQQNDIIEDSKIVFALRVMVGAMLTLHTPDAIASKWVKLQRNQTRFVPLHL